MLAEPELFNRHVVSTQRFFSLACHGVFHFLMCHRRYGEEARRPRQ